ncbi:MAG: class I SAM-dependent rRNA methyltransferase [Bryobacteraceae bacterium]|nr:class I SAM-dependent rRNA methyltransferase [Bryobacteraceae bacterium]MDW8378108.1 class I SAM-dependent rRNA methyltransferase [Bryobacterales bacterium]
MPELPEVRVSRKGANRIASGHPWIFSSDVIDRGSANPGDAVRVLEAAGRCLGTAHYSSTSQITLRMLSSRAETIDAAFLRNRIAAAQKHRDRVVDSTDAYRIVFSEADHLPGLIVDRYGDYLVLQTLTQGMDRLLPEISLCLQELFSPQALIARNDAPTRSKENLPQQVTVVQGQAPERVQIQMNGLRLWVDLLGGQKTGVFLDQRENYLAARRWAHGDALDCFTFTGGFALHVAACCRSVEAIDSSAAALALAEDNRQANSLANVSFREANTFDVLSSYDGAGRRFDFIVLDPPAFAKSRQHLDAAFRAYKEINLRALRLLRAGGILLSCSCSHHVLEADLLSIVAEAALDARKQVRILERRTQSLDHPVLLTVPETLYLKCLILQVL